MRTDEDKILEEAIQKFNVMTGFNLEIIQKGVTIAPKQTADCLLQLKTPQYNLTFYAEVKRRITTQTLGAAVEQLKYYPQKKILITNYINNQIADRLKEMQIPFLDTAGNVFLNELPLFIYIKGNKLTQAIEKKPDTLAFQAGGLKILFYLLCNPELLNIPHYRVLAQLAGVALGTVGWVFRDLKQLGYLIKSGKKDMRLVEKKKVIDRWVEGYPEKIRHKLILGRYRAKDNEWWKHADFNQWPAYWGGEVAAAKLTNYLKPEEQTIYLEKDLNKFVLQHRLTLDPRGNIEILQTFWNYNFEDPKPRETLVPPLLIYADLLRTGIGRNIETAKLIYAQHITRLIGED